MIIIRNLYEDDNLITYKDIALSFTELTRQRSIAIDSLRSEAKSLYECFVDSLLLPLEERAIKDERGDKRSIASIEQRSGGTGDYVRRSPLALESPDANDIAFRMCVILDYTPPRISILPVYVMLSHDGGMIKVRLSLSEMDEAASVFYVSRGGEKDRYDETAECIKNLLMKGISDRRPNISV
ncbi:hypothetical protein M8C91_003705 [Salmonella enterica]|nr:hypothetical protein [Salmonella enterica]EJF2226120.1 hypothetical protein [Salmonella enterica]HAC8237299.1 hypothetical protein [Salmonella enterica]HAC8271055.1 hypothetical protein [Salmonella enterica]